MTTMAYPFEITPSGKVATADGDEAMIQQVKLTLATSRGSRVMRPEFGSVLPSLVFDSLDIGSEEELHGDIKRAVQQSIAGAQVPHIDVDADEDRGMLGITVYVSSDQEVSPRTFSVSLAFGRVVEDFIP